MKSNKYYHPVTDKNNIGIVLNVSDEYAPMISLTIISILENSNPSYHYDINILETSFSEKTKKTLETLKDKYPNLSLRYIDITPFVKKYKDDFFIRRVPQETYFRLFVGDLFRGYKNLIYMDADTFAIGDISELSQIDLQDNYRAAVKDIALQALYIQDGYAVNADMKYRKYIDEILGIDIENYYQAGVLVINLKKWVQDNISEKSMKLLKEIRTPNSVDQDLLNGLMSLKTLEISPKWNYFLRRNPVRTYGSYMSEELVKKFSDAISDIRIVHIKPWMDTDIRTFDIQTALRKYVEISPYKEELLQSIEQNKTLKQDITVPDCENIEHISPAFEDNYCQVCFSASDFYAPYLSIALYSLVKNSNPNHNYDIVIFTQDIAETKQYLIKKFLEQKNISIRFYNVKKIFNNVDWYLPAYGTVTIETYFRILSPYIFNKSEKVLFLDSDMLILSDVYELYSKDLNDYAIAATHEILMEPSHIKAQCKSLNNRFPNNPDNRLEGDKLGVQRARDYIMSSGVLHTEEYFQAGLLLFNCQYFKKYHMVEDAFYNIQRQRYKTVDQDALNELCYGHVLLLDNKWNYTPKDHGNWFEYIRPNNRKKFMKIQDPKIIHFVGTKLKPWDFVDGQYHQLWWEYAKETPFYEKIFSQALIEAVKQEGSSNIVAASAPKEQKPNTPEAQTLRQELERVHFPNINNQFFATQKMAQAVLLEQSKWSLLWKKLCLSIKRRLAFSQKSKQRYEEKYNRLKKLLKDAKKYKKLLRGI